MAVFMMAEVPGQTTEGYDGMLANLADPLKNARGFITHMAGADGEMWRVFEVWESAKEASAFYAKFVDPNLPPGVKPKRHFVELHSLIRSP